MLTQPSSLPLQILVVNISVLIVILAPRTCHTSLLEYNNSVTTITFSEKQVPYYIN